MEHAAAIVGAAVIAQVAAALFTIRLGRLLRSTMLELLPAALLLACAAAGVLHLRDLIAEDPSRGARSGELAALAVSAVAAAVFAAAVPVVRRRSVVAADRGRSAAELQEKAHGIRLSLFLHQFPAHIWTTDSSLTIDMVAGRGLELIGLEPQELLGRNLETLLSSLGVVTDLLDSPRRAMAGEIVPFLTPLRGNMLEGALAPLHDADGEVVGTVGISLNVSERERASEQARNDEAMLHEILDHIPATVFLKDREGHYMWVNKRWEELSQQPRRDVVGGNDYDFFSRESAEGFRRTDEQVWSSGEAMTFVEPLMGRRRTLTLLCSKFLLRRDDGSPYVLCGIATDITERTRMEEELQRRQALLVEAQTMASLASWELNFETGMHFVSEHINEITGVEVASRGMSTFDGFLEHVHPEDRQMVLETTLRSLWDGDPYNIDFRVMTAGGDVRWLRSQGRVERDEGGVPLRFYGFAQDITGEHVAEDEIRRLTTQLERGVVERTRQLEGAVEELSSFSYAVSHDLRQPLRSIAGFLALMEEEVGQSLGDVSHFLERARSAARRMDNIIADLLALARVTHAPLRRDRVDLSDLAREISIELMRAEPGREVKWEIHERMSVSADPGLLRLVMQNLMSNALKFTRKAMRPVIEVGMREGDGEPVLFVRDNGAGFDMARAKRLFEPFQRLHDASEFEGSGIGLATVARVVRHHGGWIRAESRPQHGATFLFTLPAADDAEEEAA